MKGIYFSLSILFLLLGGYLLFSYKEVYINIIGIAIISLGVGFFVYYLESIEKDFKNSEEKLF